MGTAPMLADMVTAPDVGVYVADGSLVSRQLLLLTGVLVLRVRVDLRLTAARAGVELLPGNRPGGLGRRRPACRAALAADHLELRQVAGVVDADRPHERDDRANVVLIQ